MRIEWIFNVLLVLFIVIIQGCQESPSPIDDLQVFVNGKEVSQEFKLPALPVRQSTQRYFYQAQHLADPFDKKNVLGHREITTDNENQPDLDRNKEPLEFYDLEQLKLVGMVKYKQQPWAVFLTPESIVQQVTIGHHLGLHHGKIKNISLNMQKLSLSEVVQNNSGVWVKKNITIAFKQ